MMGPHFPETTSIHTSLASLESEATKDETYAAEVAKVHKESRYIQYDLLTWFAQKVQTCFRNFSNSGDCTRKKLQKNLHIYISFRRGINKTLYIQGRFKPNQQLVEASAVESASSVLQGAVYRYFIYLLYIYLNV